MPFDHIVSFKWQDVIDVLVISFVVHRLFLLFRGTTAFQITLGLLFLWVFQGIAQAVGLVLTSWFFQGIGAVGVLIIVVVFRNEIREVLIQTNPIRFFLGRPHRTRNIDVDLLVQTAFKLAQTGTGALLVLQNRDPLHSHLREGFTLDGKYSRHIIETIFAKQSPIHDGAAVIRGERVVKVGTFLPLTQREGLPLHFGTRHRAAIGLSEVSDAVVLVVSEERGEISVVYRGTVNLVSKPGQLRQALERSLLGATLEKKPAGSVRMWLAQAGGLLLTFLLVSTVWGIYSGKQLSLITVSAPIDFRNIPEHLELQQTSAEKVEVQITGKRRLVSALKPEQVGAFLDLGEVGGGVHQMELNQDSIDLPLGLEVVRVTPPTVRLEMEQRVEKELVIDPVMEGSPPAGYRMEKVSAIPESVKVSGAVSVLRNITALATEPIALNEIQPQDGERRVKVPLVLSPASLRLLAGQPKEVQVTLQLQLQEPSQGKQNVKKPRYYKVQAGDTLWRIARRHGLTVEELRRLNKLTKEAVIHPNQKLVVGPKGSE